VFRRLSDESLNDVFATIYFERLLLTPVTTGINRQILVQLWSYVSKSAGVPKGSYLEPDAGVAKEIETQRNLEPVSLRTFISR